MTLPARDVGIVRTLGSRALCRLVYMTHCYRQFCGLAHRRLRLPLDQRPGNESALGLTSPAPKGQAGDITSYSSCISRS